MVRLSGNPMPNNINNNGNVVIPGDALSIKNQEPHCSQHTLKSPIYKLFPPVFLFFSPGKIKQYTLSINDKKNYK
jgi:hypothetical protein